MLTNISKTKSFDCSIESYKHHSNVNNCEMAFTVILPSTAKSQKVPALYWLSGLTCTDENFTTKAGAQQFANQYGLAVVVCDTSPRGDTVAKGDAYDLGLGAGFYLNATEIPWAMNYRMYDYVVEELPHLVESHFPILADRRSISGHSMGGHGALVIGLREQKRYRSVSAFAPIVAPTLVPWGQKAFKNYLGANSHSWKEYDATELIKKHSRNDLILIDQGTSDKFLKDQLKPEVFASACRENAQRLELRMQEGYDHSYFFISTFIKDHIEFHAKRLQE